MKLLIILITYLCMPRAQAQVLLVPSADRDFEVYNEHCRKEGYFCTTKYFLETLQNSATPQFDLLIEELDYSSAEFCAQLASRSLRILKAEMISVEQVEILIKLLGQAKNFVGSQQVKSLQTIEFQLREHLDLVQKASLKELPAEFIVVFKKPLATHLAGKFQSAFLKEKIEKINFTQTLFSHESLALGNCGNENVHPSIQEIKWQIDHEKACGFSNQVTQISRASSNFIKENKNSLLVGSVIAIGAVLLLNKYEVQVTF